MPYIKLSHGATHKLKEDFIIYHRPNMLPMVSSLTERPASPIRFLMYLQTEYAMYYNWVLKRKL